MKYEVEITKTILYQVKINAKGLKDAENQAVELVNKNPAEYVDYIDISAEAYCPEEEDEEYYH